MSSSIRILPEQAQRVETGAIQFGDDWPGVFIRGDTAAYIAMQLKHLMKNPGDPIAEAVLKGLHADLASCVVGPAASMVANDQPCHGLDTPQRVCFYEQEFYVLSNFSAFKLEWHGRTFMTSEHAYHWMKFRGRPGKMLDTICDYIERAASAHDALQIARAHKEHVLADWDELKVDVMREILRAKARQHEYVRRKLMQTGARELVENSWRDDFWGWGPNRDGQNMLGKLWMELRDELQSGHRATGYFNL